MKRFLFLACFLVAAPCSWADGPLDNLGEKVRPVPPPGQPLAEADRSELAAGVEKLGSSIADLETNLKSKPALRELLPDVVIFYNAVNYALKYNEFFNATNETKAARELLKLGFERADALKNGQAPWTTATGLVVRGYRSKIDNSVQPYGLVVPPGVAADPRAPRRLDAWFHGRGETLNEINFLNGRLHSPGEFVPDNAFVLHLYGRYCNANKFAGDIDLLEALDSTRKNYAIDENRIVARGFSMGGAACWQFAAHYPGLWAAAAPGAGFAETADFLKVFQKETVNPPWWEQKLWHWYDATDYAINLVNCPTVAYSGEIDSQKQAADIMAAALKKEGLLLTHIIGPKTAHAYHPEAKKEINRRIDSIAAKGRDPLPRQIKFTTWTLRYNQVSWLTLQGLEKHWERALVSAEIVNPGEVRIQSTNVTALSLNMPSGLAPLDIMAEPAVVIDGQKLRGGLVETDRSWSARFEKVNGQWRKVDAFSSDLKKTPGLQGPIDDAFMDSFVMVSPTGSPLNENVGKWADAERKHAIDHWRKQFRGEARVVTDSELSDKEIDESNLVLWGDPASNKVLARIADKLPIKWSKDALVMGDKTYPADSTVPALIFPNPLNPKKYVVLNSGFTFREYDYLNNARQIAKLPDFAIIDISQPANARYPGKILTAGFFNEEWR